MHCLGWEGQEAFESLPNLKDKEEEHLNEFDTCTKKKLD